MSGPLAAPRARGPHFLVPPGALQEGEVVLTGDEARHLSIVLRAAPGDPVSLADGVDSLAQARIRSVGGQVVLAVVERWSVPPPTPRLTVVHALPKGRKLDEVVQRLTEVGVDRLVPAHSQRSQVRLEGAKAERALARWRAVASAAAKQSRRVRLLDVAPVTGWDEAFPPFPAGVVLWEQAADSLAQVLAGQLEKGADELVLAVGPEGGLTADEVSRAGLPAAGLGPTILRTETAALVAAAIVLHQAGRLG